MSKYNRNTGLFFLIISFILCTISCISPYWLSNPNIFMHSGLFAICYKTRDRCFWFYQDGYAWQNSLPKWMVTSQLLFSIGLAVLVVSVVCALLYQCNVCGEFHVHVPILLSLCIIISFFLMTGGIVHFGTKAHDYLNAAIQGTAYLFDWAYFCAIAGTISSFMSVVFYLISACFFKSKRSRGYSRGSSMY